MLFNYNPRDSILEIELKASYCIPCCGMWYCIKLKTSLGCYQLVEVSKDRRCFLMFVSLEKLILALYWFILIYSSNIMKCSSLWVPNKGYLGNVIYLSYHFMWLSMKSVSHIFNINSQAFCIHCNSFIAETKCKSIHSDIWRNNTCFIIDFCLCLQFINGNVFL